MFHRVLNVSLKFILYANGNVLYALDYRVNILEQLPANTLFLLWLHKSREEPVRFRVIQSIF